MNQKPWEEKRFEETEDDYKFSLAGGRVILMQFGCSCLDLSLDGDYQPSIRLGMPFAWKQGKDSSALDPENVPSLAPLLPLVGTSIEEVSATKSGFLSLKFSNGASIEAPTGEEGHDYEAWQISDNKRFLCVCAIGGEVFFFLPESARVVDGWTTTESGL